MSEYRNQLPDKWIDIIRQWAEQERLVLEAYVFGSRAKASARADSDLDVGIWLIGANESERIGCWVFEADRLREQLSPMLPVTVDLQVMGDDDIVVRPAVREHGILVFKR